MSVRWSSSGTGARRLWKLHAWRDSNTPGCSHEQPGLTLKVVLLWPRAGSDDCQRLLPNYVILWLCDMVISGCQWPVCHRFPDTRLPSEEERFLTLFQSDVQLFLKKKSIFDHCTVLPFLCRESLKFPSLNVLPFFISQPWSLQFCSRCLSADCWVEPTLSCWSLSWDSPVEGEVGLLTLLSPTWPAMWWMGLHGPPTPSCGSIWLWFMTFCKEKMSKVCKNAKIERWSPVLQKSLNLTMKFVLAFVKKEFPK